MNKQEETKIRQQLLDKGYKPISNDSMKRGNDTFKFDSKNGFNNDGNTRRGYDNCKTYVSKK